jgi:MFS superfamily sulfate permease-like transporter
LVVVVAITAVVTIFHFDETGIRIVGDLPSGLPDIGLPSIHASDIAALIPVTLACFVLAYGETISVARSFAEIDGAPAGIGTVVLDFSTVLSIDITAGAILRALVRTLKERGIAVELAEGRDEVVEKLKIVGAEDDLGSIVAHRTIEDCLAGRKDETPRA